MPATIDVRLTVIDDGPLRRDDEAFARQLRVAGRVEFYGVRSKEDVRAALMDADLLVMSSRMTGDGEAERSPVVLKAALAVGVPIVATDNAGTVEVLPPELRHEIVPENDVQALAERLASVIADRESWRDRAALGRRWVEREFDNAQLARRLSRLYEDALARC